MEGVEGVRDIDHPPEDLVESSSGLILAGFLIVGAVLILAAFNWASRGKGEDGRPDVFGKMVTVQQVSAKYQTSWAPGRFWPSKESHGSSAENATSEGSPVFRYVWMFLIAWLGISGFFLILAGALTEIEVFREESHVRAAGCVALACCLCAIWPVLFRIGSHENTIAKSGAQQVMMLKVDRNNKAFAVPSLDKSKGVWLWISFVVLGIAWLLALAGAAQLQAWTLPGPQFGTLILLGPGYGLFAGWLLYATFMNLGVAMGFDSYPEGMRAMPTGGDAEYIHRGSYWPLIASGIVALCAVIIPDPVQPLPMAISIALFTPRYRTNLGAVVVCLIGSAVAIWRVIELRESENV